MQAGARQADPRTRVVLAVLKAVKLPPRFRLKLVKDDPVRLELTLTPAYGKDPILVGLVESQDLVARRDREGRIPRDLQGTWDWTVRHGKVSTGGWNPYLKEALQTMFETGLPAIVYEETTGEAYHPVDGTRHVRDERKCCAFQPFETGCEQLRQLPHAGATTESLRPLGSFYVFRRCWRGVNTPSCRFGPTQLSGLCPGVVDRQLSAGSPSLFSPTLLRPAARSPRWPKTPASLEPRSHTPPRHSRLR